MRDLLGGGLYEKGEPVVSKFGTSVAMTTKIEMTRRERVIKGGGSEIKRRVADINGKDNVLEDKWGLFN